ncbi:hypothetical protein [Paenibacillus chitinolyticus]|uniref:hypothetical protein n=1 Tax=Paenibacillus chitinolyticus TaxID=79263 RepID=UPI003D00397F
MKENELRAVLGLPYECSDFTDEIPRIAYPVTMKDFPDFIEKARFINPKVLWNNMVFDEGKVATRYVIQKTFSDDPVDEVMEKINAGNFPQIMEAILTINGISQPEDSQEKNVMEV